MDTALSLLVSLLFLLQSAFLSNYGAWYWLMVSCSLFFVPRFGFLSIVLCVLCGSL